MNLEIENSWIIIICFISNVILITIYYFILLDRLCDIVGDCVYFK